ncbi:hypothetical protein [Asinibacterium sp. OR53]|uniref:hypothetical protein n=1 Tax=Asinibacterium sp. OR53 TaxID=925409 RepID=UPI00047D9544|nr:hypothetical protein [Asinibacterium sp. OR53]
MVLSFFAFILIFSACKKSPTSHESTPPRALTDPPLTQKVDSAVGGTSTSTTTTNGVYELTDMGGGVYQCVYSYTYAIQIQVTNITYKTKDDYGMPLAPRNGDPFYGTISTSNPPTEFVQLQPSNPLQNHFSIQQGYVNWSDGGPDFDKYNAAFNDAYNNFTLAYSAWQLQYNSSASNNPPPPQFNPPWVIDYLKTAPTSGGAGFRTITGKLIRISTGSTFAIAREDYPIPAPPPPPQYCTTCPYCLAHPDDIHCP